MRDRGETADPPLHRAWLVHPVLVGAFPVAYLFGANVDELVGLEPLWQPLAIVLAVSVAVLLLALVVGRMAGIGVERAALVASLLIGLAMTYGHAWNIAGETLRLHLYLLAAWAVLAGAGIVLILRGQPGSLRRATMAVTVGAAALLLINAGPIVALGLRSGTADGAAAAPRPTAAGEPVQGGSGRDVWYIVLDRYGGLDGLRETFGYDNTPFMDALKERGFTIAERARATYLKTNLSLLSTLNLDELDLTALRADATDAADAGPLYRAIRQPHAVGQFLRERGYRYVHVGSRRGPTDGNLAADATFLYGVTTEFGAVLADTTLLRALEPILPDATGLGALLPAQTEFQLRVLNQLVDAPGRNFVFAHLLIPHPPYVFNADGSRVTPEQRAARSPDEQYLEQLEFTNAVMLDLVDRLHAGPTEDWPIIVLAADEGPFPDAYARDEDGYRWLEAPPEALLRKFSVLCAISIPGVDRAGLEAAGFSDDLTLVNLFRVVLSAAFDADLPLLPARSWAFVDRLHFYDQVDVTERIPGA
jgi:hypothetical protein